MRSIWPWWLHLFEAINQQKGMNDFKACSTCHNMTWIQIRRKFKSKWPMRWKHIFHWWYRRARENVVFNVLLLQTVWNEYMGYILYQTWIYKCIIWTECLVELKSEFSRAKSVDRVIKKKKWTIYHKPIFLNFRTCCCSLIGKKYFWFDSLINLLNNCKDTHLLKQSVAICNLHEKHHLKD